MTALQRRRHRARRRFRTAPSSTATTIDGQLAAPASSVVASTGIELIEQHRSPQSRRQRHRCSSDAQRQPGPPATTSRFNPGGIGLSALERQPHRGQQHRLGQRRRHRARRCSFDNVVVGNPVERQLRRGHRGRATSPTPADGNLIEGNTASNNGGDGIFVAGRPHVTGNTANFNDGWGIFAEPGTIDGGGNEAVGNAEPAQCFGVVCDDRRAPGAPDTTIVDKPTEPEQQPERAVHVHRHRRHDAAGRPRLPVPPRQHRRAGLGRLREPVGATSGSRPASTRFEVRAVDAAGQRRPDPGDLHLDVRRRCRRAWPRTRSSSIGAAAGVAAARGRLHVLLRRARRRRSSARSTARPFTVRRRAGDDRGALLRTSTSSRRPRSASTPSGCAPPTPRATPTRRRPTYTWTITGLVTTITDGPAFIAAGGAGRAGRRRRDHGHDGDVRLRGQRGRRHLPLLARPRPVRSLHVAGTYTGLAVGEHLFRVIAIDPEGEPTQIEATEYEWAILAGAGHRRRRTPRSPAAPADGTSDAVVHLHRHRQPDLADGADVRVPRSTARSRPTSPSA